jgi:hypothetical protein
MDREINERSCFLRLVRGEGEIIEEMVTKEKHKEINKVTHSTTVWNVISLTQLCSVT